MSKKLDTHKIRLVIDIAAIIVMGAFLYGGVYTSLSANTDRSTKNETDIRCLEIKYANDVSTIKSDIDWIKKFLKKEDSK